MVASALFWFAVAVVAYQYVGYPLALAAVAAVRGRRVIRAPETLDTVGLPSATLVISAFNEEEVIARKVQNALDLDYPREKLEIIVASDGSTDRTNDIVRGFHDRGVVLHDYTPNRGKNLALNETMPRARGEIIVFTDANGMYERDALRQLVRPFVDPDVGSVCGELIYRNFNDNPIAEGYNRYWELDQMQKRLESALGCLLGANGSIFAVRKSLCRPIANNVCNDMVQPIWVAAAGHLCVYEPRAVSVEAGSRNLADELKRRSRIIGRGIRGIQLVWPEIVERRAWLVGWELFSRKALRYATPLWLLLMLLGCAIATSPFHRALLVLQLGVYACLPLGFLLPGGRLMRLLSPAVYFGIGALAAVLGWWKVLTGSELGRWQTAERPFETEAPVAPTPPSRK
jgi:cellulose synthase/poly-beta-1,6-N-acetylglucosamine synthase-like glycosyltransferase